MPSLEPKKFRRTWPQRTLIVFSLSFVAVLIFASVRLNKFDDAVGSIVRIEVPSGVLAEIPTEELEIQENSDSPLVAVNPAFSRNFLIIGTDSAVGLDPSDPASHRDHPEGYALADALDISHFGGWRDFIQSKQQSNTHFECDCIGEIAQ